MRTDEFLKLYPQWQEAYDNRWREYVGTSGKQQRQTFVLATCSLCGTTMSVRWQPGIINTHRNNGEYVCARCITYMSQKLCCTDEANLKKSIAMKEYRATHVNPLVEWNKNNPEKLSEIHSKAHTREVRLKASRKAMQTMGPEGLKNRGRNAWKSAISKKPDYKPCMDDIEWHFIHLMQDDPICPDPDAHHAPRHIDGVFEVDGYSPKYHKGFECDEERGHMEKEGIIGHSRKGGRGMYLGGHHNKDVRAAEQGDIIFHFVKEEYEENPEDVEERFLAWYRYGTETVPSRWDTVEYPWLLL